MVSYVSIIIVLSTTPPRRFTHSLSDFNDVNDEYNSMTTVRSSSLDLHSILAFRMFPQRNLLFYIAVEAIQQQHQQKEKYQRQKC
ncbi:CLUMA_CG019233, isoform A [Clunio marinus]|uniref:CLUMA_CG019233, isoform A n=1 Tax=Clunio marinus TaxID=568069 RepID=A0A1J1J200_9DIPT|nr:CLUMA_CG019233, isoform A [Clunio marinus]